MPAIASFSTLASNQGPVRHARICRAVAWCLGLLLAAVLVVNTPAFLCMGLDPDVSQWDQCARTVQQGGVLYRDAVENNLPGMLWVHILVRSLLGWRSEV